MLGRRIFAVAGLFCILCGIASAQFVARLGYQGVLKDAAGDNVEDGEYQITFRLYEAASGGSPIWTETQGVDVQNGVFDAVLGSITGLQSVDFDKQYWLTLSVGSGTELAPRVQLLSSPYAFMARTVPDSSIGAVKIATNAVTASKIASNAISGSKIRDGSVGSADLAANAVGIRNLSTTGAQAGQTLVYNGTSLAWASAGGISGVTAGAGLTGGGTNGTVSLSIDTAGITANMLATGTPSSGSVLTYDGTALAWGAPGGASGVVAGTGLTSSSSGGNTVLEVDTLGISTGKIAALAVTSGKLASNSVTTAKIVNNTIRPVDLNDGVSVPAAGLVLSYLNANQFGWTAAAGGIDTLSVTTGKLAQAAVTTAKLAPLSVTAAKIANLNVTAGKIANNAVTANKIALGAVTPTKLLAVTTPGSPAVGDILTYNGTDFKWEPPAASGGLTSVVAGTGISATTVGSVATVSVAPLGIGTTELAAASVTSAKLAFPIANVNAQLSTSLDLQKTGAAGSAARFSTSSPLNPDAAVDIRTAGTSALNVVGNVQITGDLDISGAVTKGSGTFKIDHPLDPENKYLYHSFVESPEMMNVYNGNVVLDENGEALVVLPDWFEALNADFRYQLTPIGGFAPLFVKQEIEDGQFQVAGGTEGLKVSWQVTGVRNDPFARKNRVEVEVEKAPENKGTYLHPEAYDQPESRREGRTGTR